MVRKMNFRNAGGKSRYPIIRNKANNRDTSLLISLSSDALFPNNAKIAPERYIDQWPCASAGKNQCRSLVDNSLNSPGAVFNITLDRWNQVEIKEQISGRLMGLSVAWSADGHIIRQSTSPRTLPTTTRFYLAPG
jgi:hypothetical protein